MSSTLNTSYIRIRIIGELYKFEQYTLFSELSLDIEGKEFVPDVCIYKQKKADFLNDILRVTEMPLLAIEILSPRQGVQDAIDKIKVYVENGISKCWLIEPVTSVITVFDSKLNKKTYSEGILKDENLNIEIDLAIIFK